MALDGIVISSIVKELNDKLINSRIEKIFQPEKDELIINLRGFGSKYKLLMSCHAYSNRLHITNIQKENPLKAPAFCMVLRKHLNNGKIVKIYQPNFERIVKIEIETLNELADITKKIIIIEMMGKHSNIILIDENEKIVDSIKHIGFEKSSVREILPGKMYYYPPSQNKLNPLNLNEKDFINFIKNNKDLPAQNILFNFYTGISPIISSSICLEAGIQVDMLCRQLHENMQKNIFNSFNDLISKIKNNEFDHSIILNEKNNPIDMSSVHILKYEDNNKQNFTNPSEMLDMFYKEKDLSDRLKQKSYDINKIITLNIQRCVKKDQLYTKTLSKIIDRDKLKICGELITSNIYLLSKGMKEFSTENFYSENLENITIKLNHNMTPVENAQNYFKKYNKEKRTYNALLDQIIQNNQEKIYLESILNNLNNCINENDIMEIRSELSQSGFIKKRVYKKGEKIKLSKPLLFKSTNNFEIYVGKNNVQNDNLTLKFANNSDYWFHVKDLAGSHVILKTSGLEPSIEDITEAANFAALYSKAKDSSNVPVDYALKKFVKKPSGAKPGMVIYKNNKTIYVNPNPNLNNITN